MASLTLMATQMASVEVEREFDGLTDHLRGYKVVVDKEVIGSLGPGESCAFDLVPGPHEIFMKVDWARSEKLDLRLMPGETAVFRCSPRGNIITALYWASFGFRRYIRLARVAA